ncbi:calcium channel protein [Ascosphaera acerosa]|nr:calcium channel protein [Ascosphaera acerosa]
MSSPDGRGQRDGNRSDIPLQDLSLTGRHDHDNGGSAARGVSERLRQQLTRPQVDDAAPQSPTRAASPPPTGPHISWQVDTPVTDRTSYGSHGTAARSLLGQSIGRRRSHYTRLSDTTPGVGTRRTSGGGAVYDSGNGNGNELSGPGDRESFNSVRLSVDLASANETAFTTATTGTATTAGTTATTVGAHYSARQDQDHSPVQHRRPHRPSDPIATEADLTTYPHILASPSHESFGPVSFAESSEDTTPLNPLQQDLSGGRSRWASPGQRAKHHEGNNSSRLGDDLRVAEEGLSSARSRHHGGGSDDRSRSLSPSNISDLSSRAGSVMRMMSQRVVNLGNEPEMIEQSLRVKQSRNRSRSRDRNRGGDDSVAASPAREGSRTGAGAGDATPLGPSFDDITAQLGDQHATAGDAAATPEKSPSPAPRLRRAQTIPWRRPPNPLKGRSLGIFGPDNRLRKWLCDVLIHPVTEPLILMLIILQTILLSIEASLKTRKSGYIWSVAALDAAFFGLFVVYTLEILMKAIVSGLIFNAEEYSTLDRSLGWRRAVVDKFEVMFTAHRHAQSTSLLDPVRATQQASIIRSFTGQAPEIPSTDPMYQQRLRLARRAFLRHSFNRLDFIAVVSYWIAFALAATNIATTRHIFVFRMMSCLRILRLLSLTTGTSVILLSLKKAAPILLNVAFLMGFFWLLFAIVGVQSFKSSFLRQCVWVNPQDPTDTYVIDNGDVPQMCGGFLDNSTGAKMPWRYHLDVTDISNQAKGFICPRNSQCVQGSENPYDGTLSFDDIFHSLEAVFVIMSSNTFTDLLYYTTDSDYLAASLFWITGYVILALWLVNLLVAVITSSFQIIREETKRSAFASDNVREEGLRSESVCSAAAKVSTIKRYYDRTYYLWIAIIAFDLVIQCLRSASMGEDRRHLIDTTETVVTALLAAEIAFRFVSDHRRFHRSWRNWIDLFLAVITTIMQAPRIRHSRAYMGMTIFQILRAYRIVIAFAMTRELVGTVFRNAYGLANLILFVFLVTFLASIFAIELFRTQIEDSDIDFNNIYNSFLGMYQILSSENWTDILYAAVESTKPWNTSWISALFIIIWFMFANLVVLNMFIAVIQESFDLPEEDKRLEQIKAFVRKKYMGAPRHNDVSISTILGFKKVGGDEPLDRSQAGADMLSIVVEEFLRNEPSEKDPPVVHIVSEDQSRWNILSRWYKYVRSRVWEGEPNPFYDRDDAKPTMHLRDLVKQLGSEDRARKQAKREYLEKYPTYNVTLCLFSPRNRLRRMCQRLVGPGRGAERFDGVEPLAPLRFAFSTFIYTAIIVMVVIACVVSPLYQQRYYGDRDPSSKPWFVWTDIGFAVLFTVEVVIKVIADGMFWTPNAYFRGPWGLIDGIVLVTMWINVVTAFSHDTTVLRVVGAFRALRALRLLNLSTSARETFHAVIIKGWWKVISAAFVAMSFLIPFAIYGLNLFNGQLKSCNDADFSDVFDSDLLDNCIGEYMDSPYNWDIVAPRVVSNPYYSFDNFAKSLFILFQIVSQEGWIDVLWATMGINGQGRQPKEGVETAYGLFFVVFNLLGSVFVLTLFVSVFMRNYTEETGVAYLTSEQRSWQELRKMLLQVSPSRGRARVPGTWQDYCYQVASAKHGKWARFMTVLLCFHLVVLVAEYRTQPTAWDRAQDIIFLVLHVIYIANIVLRIIGLTWRQYRRSSWDMYGLIAISGSFITSLLEVVGFRRPGLRQTNKLFLVAVTLLLIPRNNQLDQLFKTGAASLPSIASLLATWFVLFLAYAIALTQLFGLTKFAADASGTVNFRDVPRALILLFRMSCGEGWNEIMEDYAQMTYPACTPAHNFFDSDCGSLPWARALFISWNLVSMYIFVSLFVSLVFENFSYVYQRSSEFMTLSREELRRFKQTWALYDPEGTGFIRTEDLPRFLKHLTGKFEMRVYSGNFRVDRFVDDFTFVKGVTEPIYDIGPLIKSVPKKDDNDQEVWIDLGKLNRRCSRIPVQEIRKRRAKLAEFCEDVLVDAKVSGISFSSCIMTLAHYNMINEWQSMKLDELLRRLVRKQRVQDTVRRKTVQNFINAWIVRKRYRDRKRGAATADHSTAESARTNVAIPEILIDNEQYEDSSSQPDSPQVGPETPMLSPPSTDGLHARTRMSLPRIDTSYQEPATSPTTQSPSFLSRLSNLSPALSWRGRSMSVEDSQSPGGLSDGESTVSAHDVRSMLASLDASAWGESMRRSFQSRRSGSPASDRSPLSPRSPR